MPLDIRGHVGRLAVALLMSLPISTGADAEDLPQSKPGGPAGEPVRQLAQACPNVFRPVCGRWRGRWRNFTNQCWARRAGARNIRRGRCAGGSACPRIYRPVCARWRGRRRTFSNACTARRARARIIRAGQCRGGGGGAGSRCYVGNARISVSIPGSCGAQNRRLNLPFRWMSHGQQVRRRVNSGPIGEGAPPFGKCNFHTNITYRCLNRRLRIDRVWECRQARSNRTGARCRVLQ